jgi:hypothetical protein
MPEQKRNTALRLVKATKRHVTTNKTILKDLRASLALRVRALIEGRA